MPLCSDLVLATNHKELLEVAKQYLTSADYAAAVKIKKAPELRKFLGTAADALIEARAEISDQQSEEPEEEEDELSLIKQVTTLAVELRNYKTKMAAEVRDLKARVEATEAELAAYKKQRSFSQVVGGNVAELATAVIASPQMQQQQQRLVSETVAATKVEQEEQQKRAPNLIIYGLAEEITDTELPEKVSELLQDARKAAPGVLDAVSSVRVGKKPVQASTPAADATGDSDTSAQQSAKCRPVLVSFPSADARLAALRALKTLRQQGHHRTLKFEPDLTKQQRELRNLLLNSFKNTPAGQQLAVSKPHFEGERLFFWTRPGKREEYKLVTPSASSGAN